MKYSQLGKSASLLLFAFVSASSFASGWTFQTLDSTGFYATDVLSVSGGRAYGRGSIIGVGSFAISWDLQTGAKFVHGPAGSGIFGSSSGVSVGTVAGRATRWDGQSSSGVDLHPSGWSGSSLYATDGQQHVGFAYNGNQYAGLWDATSNAFANLHPAGYLDSASYGVSNGRQVGYARNSASQSRAGWWSGSASTWQEFGGTPGSGQARDIDGSEAVGFENISGNTQAVLWNLDLGTKTVLSSALYGASAQAVHGGYQVGHTNGKAAIWNGSAASYEDLGALTPALHGSVAESILWEPSQITVGGYMVNYNTSQRQAAIWTKAVPEPGTLLAVALGGVFLRRKKK